MKYGSLFRGSGGFDLALNRVGFESLYAAEIDHKCNSVCKRHWPDENQIKDVALVDGRYRPDVLCAGWPCQGNSVAGRRAGMADSRSGLWGQVVRILNEQRPRWFLGENVPGILSVNEGRDWATVLGDLAELGYGFAYRVLDAQWFGVPQRRRRVFIVGRLGDWRSPVEILFEREGLPWDSPPSREAGARIAHCIANGTGSSGYRYDANGEDFVTGTLTSNGDAHSGFRDMNGIVAHTLRGEGFDASEDGTGRGTPLIPIDMRQASRGAKFTNNRTDGGPPGTGIGEDGDPCPTLADSHTPAIAFAQNQRDELREMSVAGALAAEPGMKQQTYVYQCQGSNVGPMGALRAGNCNESGGVPFTIHGTDTNGKVASPDAIAQCIRTRAPGSTENSSTTVVQNTMGVRRLMPIECERLQGFPDDWTRYGANGEEMADSTRYRMMGNAVAVPCVQWIAERIMHHEGGRQARER